MAKLTGRTLILLAAVLAAWPGNARAQTPTNPALQEAVAAYVRGERLRARDQLNAVRPESLDVRDRAIRELYLGFVHLTQREEGRARAAFGAALVADATVTPDPTAHPEELLARYWLIREELKGVPAQVVVTPGLVTLPPGGSIRLGVDVLAADGSRILGIPVEMVSLDPQVIQVAPDGLITAAGPGAGRLRVTARGAGTVVQISVGTAAEGVAPRPAEPAAPPRQEAARPAAPAPQAPVPAAPAPQSSQVPLPQGLKSPAIVFVSGLLFPGMGQFQAGRPTAGMVTLFAAGGAAAWGILATKTHQRCLSPLRDSSGACPGGDVADEWKEQPMLPTGLGIAGGIALISAIEAATQVAKRNRGVREASRSAALSMIAQPRPGGALALGLRLPFGGGAQGTVDVHPQGTSR